MLLSSASSHLKYPVSRRVLEGVFNQVVRAVPILKNGVEITLVTVPHITKLNFNFRGKKKPTDVLSFSFAHERKTLLPPGFHMVGQMYLSPVVIKKQAARLKIPYKIEFVRMFVHGLLHCAGMDHMEYREARHMFTIQEKIVRKTIAQYGMQSGSVPRTLSDSYFKESFVFPDKN